jgi:hypothetical protein
MIRDRGWMASGSDLDGRRRGVDEAATAATATRQYLATRLLVGRRSGSPALAERRSFARLNNPHAAQALFTNNLQAYDYDRLFSRLPFRAVEVELRIDQDFIGELRVIEQ